jgi:hypothetical protein
MQHTFLYLDSSHARTDGNGNYEFQLSSPGISYSQYAQIDQICLSNTIRNIKPDSYFAFTGGVYPIIRLQAGYYESLFLIVGELNRVGERGFSVAIATDGYSLEWTMADSSVVIDGSMSSNLRFLGIEPNRLYAGTFTTRPILGTPTGVSFFLQQLDQNTHVSSSINPCRSSIVCPLRNGFGMQESFQPPYPVRLRAAQKPTAITTLTVSLTDPSSNTPLRSEDAHHWTMILTLI